MFRIRKKSRVTYKWMTSCCNVMRFHNSPGGNLKVATNMNRKLPPKREGKDVKKKTHRPASSKCPFDSPNGGHVFTPEKVTNKTSLKGHERKNLVRKIIDPSFQRRLFFCSWGGVGKGFQSFTYRGCLGDFWWSCFFLWRYTPGKLT